jgi:hypothetical protein
VGYLERLILDCFVLRSPVGRMRRFAMETTDPGKDQNPIFNRADSVSKRGSESSTVSVRLLILRDQLHNNKNKAASYLATDLPRHDPATGRPP